MPYHYGRLTYGQRVKPRVEGRAEVEVREVDWGQVGKGLNKCHFIPMEYKLKKTETMCVLSIAMSSPVLA